MLYMKLTRKNRRRIMAKTFHPPPPLDLGAGAIITGGGANAAGVGAVPETGGGFMLFSICDSMAKLR
jgi:hypothetical protein